MGNDVYKLMTNISPLPNISKIMLSSNLFAEKNRNTGNKVFQHEDNKDYHKITIFQN